MGTGVSAAMHDFLMSRRARLTPEAAGLPAQGRRRVPGLRREEVAALAGVSTEYYVQIERGRLQGISNDVLDRISNALQLSEVERAHFANLVRHLRTSRTPAAEAPDPTIPPGVQALSDLLTTAAAAFVTPRLNLIGGNTLGRALFRPVFPARDRATNLADFVFLDPRSRTFFTAWDSSADEVVAALLLAWGNDPYDRRLAALVERLSAASAEFRMRWTKHDVDPGGRTSLRLVHPLVGPLELRCEQLEVPGTGLTILNYFALPGDASYRPFRTLSNRVAAEEPLPGCDGELGESGESQPRRLFAHRLLRR